MLRPSPVNGRNGKGNGNGNGNGKGSSKLQATITLQSSREVSLITQGGGSNARLGGES